MTQDSTATVPTIPIAWLVIKENMAAQLPIRWKLLRARRVPRERIHQRRVSTVAMGATAAAKDSTALIQALSALMMAAFRVPKDRIRRNQAPLSASSVRKNLVMALATQKQATPDVSRYHQVLSSTSPATLPPNVSEAIFVGVALVAKSRATRARTRKTEALSTAFHVHQESMPRTKDR